MFILNSGKPSILKILSIKISLCSRLSFEPFIYFRLKFRSALINLSTVSSVAAVGLLKTFSAKH